MVGISALIGDILLRRLNMEEKPIANKYCEGKVKRALKRGLKDVKPLERKVLRLATVGGMSIGKGMRRERTKSP